LHDDASPPGLAPSQKNFKGANDCAAIPPAALNHFVDSHRSVLKKSA
jgi:hypothetical protein